MQAPDEPSVGPSFRPWKPLPLLWEAGLALPWGTIRPVMALKETASPPGLRRTVPFLNEINHLYDFIDTHNESWCKVERVSRPMSKEGIYERQSEGHPGGLPRRDAVPDR